MMTLKGYVYLAAFVGDMDGIPVMLIPSGDHECIKCYHDPKVELLVLFLDAEDIDTEHEIPPAWIVEHELSPTSLWDKFNIWANRDTTLLTEDTPVHKYLLDDGHDKLWIYVDPAIGIVRDH